WLLTQNGLFVCKRKEKKVSHIYDTTFGGTKFSYNAFWDGAFDKQDNLWLVSPNGIHVYNTKKNEMVNNFTMANGLPALATTSIAVDKENRIWVNTVAGLALYNQEEKIWRSFNRFDGMDRDYLDGTISITSNGKIVIDQSNGFLMKDVTEILSSADVPVLQITSITINDKEASSSPQSLKDKKLELPFNQNNISIEFAAMDWLYPFKTNYLVKIDGLQSANTWTANPDARINLTGLSPGNYVAHIKAINSSGIWSNEINFSISVNPPFWQTPWFIVLSLLAIAILLYLLYRFRIQQLLKMQNLRNDISRDLHDEIGSSVSSVNMLALVAKKQLGEQHPVTPLLSQIGESAQNAGDSIDEIIWSVNPHNDSAQETINRLRKYILDVFEIHGIEYTIQLPEFDGNKKLSMQVRRDLWLICKEAINNLVKYAHCSKAVVEMDIANGILRVKIQDDGTGFDIKEASTKKRNGLRNMSERVRKYKTGTFSIDSVKDKGTTVLFQIPIVE
ncbi:MAG: ATP-binding protein, partial [Chitinophagaceae bacterium]